MIVTLTPNPALDVTVETAVVRPGEKLRCTEVRYDPGGGGINVARVAHALGAEAMAVFPVGGLTGRRVLHLMEAAGVPISPVTISGLVRESFTVDEASTGRQFRFVLPGPALTAGEQRRLLDTFAQALGSDTYAVASGSLPPGVSADFYNDVARIARDRGVRLALDSSGLGLNGLRTPVFLLKPSIRELSELVSRSLATPDEQLAAARGLVDAGLAEVVLVSLAADGVLLVTATQHCRLPAIPVPPGSGVGAGDARRGHRAGSRSRVAPVRRGRLRDGGGGRDAALARYRRLPPGRRRSPLRVASCGRWHFQRPRCVPGHTCGRTLSLRSGDVWLCTGAPRAGQHGGERRHEALTPGGCRWTTTERRRTDAHRR